jgi:uncharacterized protein GlcG (DUF336 family)
MSLTLTMAQTLVAAALAEARRRGFQPLAVVVLDARGVVKAAAAEDGTSLKRFEIAHGKAYGALSLGVGSRALAKRAVEQPSFVAAVTHAIGGSLVPVPGGVLLRDRSGTLLGVAGASGDLSDNDEAALLAGIAAADLVPDTGA